MAIKFEKITPGMTLWDFHKYTMGNTKMKAWGRWHVYVVSVDPEKRTAVVKWNGNPETTYREHELRKLYASEEGPKAYRDQQERKRNGSWW